MFWKNNAALILGALCYYLAEPSPLNVYLWWLAFLVPVFWGRAVVSCQFSESGNSTGNYQLSTYLTAFVFWLASIWWISCPHPATIAGLIALSAFLSLYWVIFFYAARVAYHKFKIPLWIAMPVCWMGTEFLRCHILGGFSFCALEHCLYRHPFFIQPAFFGGQYLVGGMIMFYGAAVSMAFSPAAWQRVVLRWIVIFLFLPFITFAGFIHSFRVGIDDHFYSVALLQGNVPLSLNTAADASEKTFEQLVNLTYDAVKKRKEDGNAPYDLLVFPETTCPIPYLVFSKSGKCQPSDIGLTDEQAADCLKQLQTFVNGIDTPAVFGISAYEFTDSKEPQRYNTALYLIPKERGANEVPPPDVRRSAALESFRYDKMQLVMFGEYIPFSEYLPDNFFLKTLCQEAGRGKTMTAFPLVSGFFPEHGTSPAANIIPNICFESSVPHFIRRTNNGTSSILLNLSNDAWFRFSRQIDQHLATHVFRAVENGMPCITATNGGFSAIISDVGKIEYIGKRGAAQVVEGIVLTPKDGQSPTVYQRIGDIPSGTCAVFTLLFVLAGFIRRPKEGKMHPQVSRCFTCG
ncbi:apolipoprotein N-acyltransferase 1 [Planctomycetales bacterium]|nr:apolipoprotein N-acyltransferase 1 [Planctomycetales bacterium]